MISVKQPDRFSVQPSKDVLYRSAVTLNIVFPHDVTSVAGQHCVIQTTQRVIRRQGFAVVHIKPGTGDGAVLQCGDQCV